MTYSVSLFGLGTICIEVSIIETLDLFIITSTVSGGNSDGSGLAAIVAYIVTSFPACITGGTETWLITGLTAERERERERGGEE